MDNQIETRLEQAHKTTQDMHDFHLDAWDHVDKLEQLVRQMKGKGPELKAALEGLGEVLGFVDVQLWPHFKQEEETVYALLKEVLPVNRRRSVGVMIKEHQATSEQVHLIKQLLRQALADHTARVSGEASPVVQLRQACLKLVRMMRRHIAKENLLYQSLIEAP